MGVSFGETLPQDTQEGAKEDGPTRCGRDDDSAAARVGGRSLCCESV